MSTATSIVGLIVVIFGVIQNDYLPFWKAGSVMTVGLSMVLIGSLT